MKLFEFSADAQKIIDRFKAEFLYRPISRELFAEMDEECNRIEFDLKCKGTSELEIDLFMKQLRWGVNSAMMGGPII